MEKKKTKKKNERNIQKKMNNNINKKTREKKREFESLLNNEEKFLELKNNLKKRYESFIKNNSKRIDENLERDIEAFKRVQEIKKYEKIDDNENYKYYPELYDLYFSNKILKKKEFNKYQINRKNIQDLETLQEESSKLCNYENFKLSNTQRFLKNFISKQTPYNGVLIFHGVGVGKTCSAISIAEGLKDDIQKNNKKIYILANSLIQDNFKREILNKKKILQSVRKKLPIIPQCTGNNYKEMLGDVVKYKGDSLDKLIDKIIKKNYKMMGYRQFANFIDYIEKKAIRGHNEEKHEYLKRKSISDMFSNTVLILDEAHNIREGDGGGKLAPPAIQKAIKYSTNLKLILLSATPMYNNVSEIIFLLNLLLINDDRPKIEEHDIFDSNNNIKEMGKEILRKISTGYISYLRGENPLSFPKRLYPENILKKKEMPKYDVKGEYIEENERIKFLKLYKSGLKNDQYEIYKNYTKNVENINNNNIEKITPDSMIGQSELQVLNIVFPNLEDNDITKNSYGQTGLKQYFKLDQRSELDNSYKCIYKKKLKKNILDLDNLGDYSCKFRSIIESIKKSKGIVFIYTGYVWGGALPLALALEQNGISRYGGESNQLLYYESDKFKKRENICYKTGKTLNEIKDKKNFKKATYVILTGDDRISDSRKTLDLLIDPDPNVNKDGCDIKVIIGTAVAGEGLDFKRIREIHILEPWFHLSKIEQVIGRGLRNCSHMGLDLKKRNITIYLHVATNPEEDDIETYDLKIYRKAEEKALVIGEITRILKENAVDCGINYKGNVFLDKNYNNEDLKSILTQPIKILNSQGKEIETMLEDQPFSYICDYQKDCNYKCNNIESLDLNENELNSDTFNISHFRDDIENIKDIIKNEIFLSDDILDLKNIMIKVQRIEENAEKIFIYKALDEIVNNKKEIIKNIKKGEGYLIYKGDKYIYQSKKYNDEKAPLYYRRLPEFTRRKIQKKSEKKSKNQVNMKSNIINKKNEFDSYINQLSEIIKNEASIYKELEVLFRTIKHNLMIKLLLVCHPKIKEICIKNNIHGPLIGKITKTDDYYFKEHNLRYLNGYEDEVNIEIRFDELGFNSSNKLIEYYILNYEIKTNSKDKQLILNNLEKIISGYLLRNKDNLFYNNPNVKKNHIIGYKNCNYLYEIEKTVNFEKAFIYKKFIKEENKFKDFTSEDLRLIKESDIKKNIYDVNLGAVVGFIGYKKNKDQKIFKYMTVEDRKIEGTRTGKTCEEVSNKEKIYELFKLLDILSIINKNTNEYKKIFDRKLGMIQRPTEGDNTKEYSYNTTCNELQRRLKKLNKDNRDNLRWYFRPYENDIIQNYYKNQK